MRFTSAALVALSIAISSLSVSAVDDAASEGESPKKTTIAGRMMVNRYEGPKDCAAEEKVKTGDFLQMHYVGSIDASSKTGEQGKKFDSSRDRGTTFNFQVGVGQVIKGWDTGLMGLCKGAKAKLVIPPEMAYGEQGAGKDIPGGATLNFDVEVVDVSNKAPPGPNIFKEIDTDEDGKLTKEEVEAFFQEKKKTSTPDGLWESEDKDGNGYISWEEFGGSKGDKPGGDEL